MAVTRSTTRLVRRLRRDIGVEVDTAARDITHAWVAAWDTLTPAWRAAATDLALRAQELERPPGPAEQVRIPTVTAALRASEEALQKLAATTATQAIDAARRVIAIDTDLEPRIIASQAPATQQEALHQHVSEDDTSTVSMLVQSRIETGIALDEMTLRTASGQIHSATMPLPDEAVHAMRVELVRGIQLGENPRKVAKNIVDRAGGAFHGGLTRALNISRTEILDAYRRTSAQIHAANSDVVEAWEWYAELDDRTCVGCWSMHGTVHPLSEPGPDDHQQGRCTRLPVLKSWSDLGITAAEPADDLSDAEGVFRGLSADRQLAIMGPVRLALWRSGQVSWADLARWRETPNWRRSVGPTPIRELQRIAAERKAALAKPKRPRRPKKKTPPPPTPTQLVERGDFSQLRQVGPQAGSNAGGLFEAADGSRWYVKAMPEARARNEALAAALYRAAGVDVPTVALGRAAPGLAGEMQLASRIVTDATPLSARQAATGQVREQLRQGFAVDAWLANWDVVGLGFDNIVMSGGRVYRIDVGGSLRYRAQGSAKGDAFGRDAPDWLTLRDPQIAPQASQVFTGMLPAEQLAALQRLSAVRPQTVRRLVREHGLDDDLADLLIARRQDLLARARTLRATAERYAAFEQAMETAVTRQEALDAVPRRLTMGREGRVTITPMPEGWTSDRMRRAVEAAADYRGAGYQPINAALRSTEGKPQTWKTQIRHIDAVMRTVTLQDNILTWRGVRSVDWIDGWNRADVTGLVWRDWGYSSTSTLEHVSQGFAGSGGVLMRLVQVRGTRAFQLSDMSYEAEILLPRGTRFRVLADHGMVDGYRRIDVEIL